MKIVYLIGFRSLGLIGFNPMDYSPLTRKLPHFCSIFAMIARHEKPFIAFDYARFSS